MNKTLSTRQESMLNFIRQYIQEKCYPPSLREIGKHVGISSTSVVNYNLNALVKKGFIERDKGGSRRLRLAKTTCTWGYDDGDDYWETSCDGAFQLVDGTPADNGMKFCPYCGRPIEEVSENDQED